MTKHKSALLMRFLFLLTTAVVLGRSASAYNTVYNGDTYTSAQPYNLNIYYFKAADVPLDPGYTRRISGMMLWLQNWYGLQMQAQGYGFKTFGLYTKQVTPDSVRIVMINGARPLNDYRATNTGGNTLLINEVSAFRAANPLLDVSQHALILIAAPSLATSNGLPFYGIGRNCYATDYPTLQIDSVLTPGPNQSSYVSMFGGIAHELGHGLNLPHSHSTASEQIDPSKGVNLMSNGNYTLTRTPTFLNRAGCSILNDCQLFGPAVNPGFYDGHVAGFKTVRSSLAANVWTISGRFISNRTVTDINAYQDAGATPSAGYAKIAFSAAPIGTDSFRIAMPVSEVMGMTMSAYTYPSTGPYNLQLELVLANGETQNLVLGYTYQNGEPVFTAGFNNDYCAPVPAPWAVSDLGTPPFAPGDVCYDAGLNNIHISSYGDGYTGTSDNVTYLSTNLNGMADTITARVTAVSTTWNHYAGVMMRTSASAGAPFLSIGALDTRGVFTTWRATQGAGSAYQVVTALPLPMWVRVVSNASGFRAYYASDGVNWTLYRTLNVVVPATYNGGIMLASTGSQATVDRVTLNRSPLFPLPVKLISFSAVRSGSTARLAWTTAAGSAADRFAIERSSDGILWSLLGEVEASKSINGKDYSYTDPTPPNGSVRYRIASWDEDGSIAYSSIKTIHFGLPQDMIISISPNPVLNQLLIAVSSWELVRTLTLYDATGRAVYRVQHPSAAILDMSAYTPGLYLLEAVGRDGSRQLVRVIKS